MHAKRINRKYQPINRTTEKNERDLAEENSKN